MVTALALSPRPLAISDAGCEQGRSNDPSPLVALADGTTRTVAVLALPRSNRPSSTTHIPINGGTDDGADGRGGDDGGDEEGRGGAVGHLRLVSVWPCREKVTSLVAASGTPTDLVDSEDGGRKNDNRGEEQQHQRRQHQHQQVLDEASRFAGGCGRNRGGMFLVGSASGTVWTVEVQAPNSQMK